MTGSSMLNSRILARKRVQALMGSLGSQNTQPILTKENEDNDVNRQGMTELVCLHVQNVPSFKGCSTSPTGKRSRAEFWSVRVGRGVLLAVYCFGIYIFGISNCYDYWDFTLSHPFIVYNCEVLCFC